VSKKHIIATSAKSACKKASGKNVVVTKVNYIKGSKKGNKKTYAVTTRQRKN